MIGFCSFFVFQSFNSVGIEEVTMYQIDAMLKQLDSKERAVVNCLGSFETRQFCLGPGSSFLKTIFVFLTLIPLCVVE